MAVARVIIDLALDKAFDYLVPPVLDGVLKIGDQVTVPFGRSDRDGYVLALAETSSFPNLKAIKALSPGGASLPEPLITLGRWMAEYYCCSQEQAIKTLLPSPVRQGKVKFKLEKYFFLPDPAAARKFVEENREKKSVGGRISLLETLLDYGESPLAELLQNAGASRSSLKTLERDGLVAAAERTVRRDPFAGREVIAAEPLPPSAEQAAALKLIDRMLRGEEERHVLLLRGVTNSGKTEVYLQAIARALELGRSAIVLVPEISLTPQTVRRFRARFGDKLSVMHSQLTAGERFDEWHRIRRGEAAIVVGARSALFAPLANLGLIVVDEEHEGSYKQSEAPRYSARDVAVMRGKLEKAVVILGSATPAAESNRNAEVGKYLLAELKQQVGAKRQPVIRIVDQRLGGPPEPGRANFFSKILIDAVQERLEKGEQSILFLNRRGYARIMLCEVCGFEAYCPDCSVPYIYSRQNRTLTCHLCGGQTAAPDCCPDCGAAEIRYQGVGTEKIEAAAQAIFPAARIARMDSDSMRGASDYEKVLGLFRQGKVDILIGTQMIAKGLHFPNVTLVGIINADSGLLIPDFRAPERTFQLITQVAGRAGRGDERGEVIIQTYNPENETIRFAADSDFEGFRRYDLEVRELLHYPPFSYLIAIHFRGEDESRVAAFAEHFTEQLRKHCPDSCRLTGPSPSPIDRIKGKYRYMTILRGIKLGRVRQCLREMILRGKTPRDLDVYADVDAQSLM